MKPIATIIFCLFFSPILNAQKPGLTAVIDTIIQIMRTQSVNSAAVDWPSVRSGALEKARHAETGEQLGEACRLILKAANEYHGFISYGDSVFRWSAKEPVFPEAVTNAWKKGVFVQTKSVANGIRYLRVPYISFSERHVLDSNAQNLNDSLCYLLMQNPKGLILDLRLNGGGAMFPMILGLQQLLGEGELGSFTSEPKIPWMLREDRFFSGDQEMTKITPICKNDFTQLPLAILIGPGTGSSGEFLAMAFKGRKNTIFLGENTGGYVTATKGTSVNKDLYLLISECYGRDRNGNVYREALSPDIRITTPDNFDTIGVDPKVLAAIRWLDARKRKAPKKH